MLAGLALAPFGASLGGGGGNGRTLDEDELDTGSNSMHRVDGDPDLPQLRLDLLGTGLNPDVRGGQLRLQAGFGPFAFQSDWLELAEQGPGLPKLDRVTLQGLLRVSPVRTFEVDLGVGTTMLIGNTFDQGWALSLPVTYSPARWCALRWTPLWSFLGGNVLSDQDLSIWWMHRYISCFAGWRWISAGSAQIDGPALGVSFSL